MTLRSVRQQETIDKPAVCWYNLNKICQTQRRRAKPDEKRARSAFLLCKEQESIKMEKTVKLLAAAGVLMLLAGAIFGFMRQWICAGLLLAGAFGCLIAALNFRNRKNRES